MSGEEQGLQDLPKASFLSGPARASPSSALSPSQLTVSQPPLAERKPEREALSLPPPWPARAPLHSDPAAPRGTAPCAHSALTSSLRDSPYAHPKPSEPLDSLRDKCPRNDRPERDGKEPLSNGLVTLKPAVQCVRFKSEIWEFIEVEQGPSLRDTGQLFFSSPFFFFFWYGTHFEELLYVKLYTKVTG